jgi:putative DNA primase/helicase
LDPEKGALLPHRPEHRLRTKLNIHWDPATQCPRWLQFLDEIFGKDSDAIEKATCLQQWFGYCLVRDSSLHKFTFLVGSGGNGKSVCLDVLKSLLGDENVSHAHLGQLEDPAIRAELENKLVNISAELGGSASLGEYFKAVVSGDPVLARRLYQAPFSFRPYVRLICATNELPRLTDHSRGFERRAIILRFNREFSEAERDTTILEKLVDERAGILAWAVKGLQQLRRQGCFIIPASSVAELTQYKKDSDNVHLFVEEELEVHKERTGGLEPKELYPAYANWCRENGYGPTNKNNFGKRLKNIGVGERESNGRKYWLVKWKNITARTTVHTPGAPTSNLLPFRKYQV